MLERLRREDNAKEVIEQANEETPENTSNQARVELVDEEDETMLVSGPGSYVKHLCDQAEPTREQHGPAALLARGMQHAYEQELARRALLTDAQRRAEVAVLQST